MRGGEDLGDAAGVDPVQRVGYRHELALVHRAQLSLATAADDRHHAVALGETLGAGAARDDLAGELETRDVGRRAGRRRVVAGPLVDVGAVEAGGAHAHEHLAGAGLRVGVLGDENLAVADRGGAHGRGV